MTDVGFLDANEPRSDVAARDANADAASTEGGATGSPALRWLGRTEKVANGTRIDWPGTGFVARFSGTGATVRLTTTLASAPADYYAVSIDDRAPTPLTTAAGVHDYDLARGLAFGEHTVTLWRRTEPLGSSVDVGAVTFEGGALLPPSPTSGKRLEIVGDSISVGFGVECTSNSEGFTYATENNYGTYGAIAARALGAELVTVAWSGIGMYRDVGGATTASGSPQMPVRYLRAVGHENASVWDFSQYAPGAVVVHLGTNDFAQGDPGTPFVQAYVDFVRDVRTRYPRTRIYVAVSPMLSDAKRTSLAGYLQQVLSTRAASGDANLAILTFATPSSTGWGCGHPNAATHEVMANVLVQTLKSDLGW
jgi:lysophospholipase L1-like esterase